MGNKKKKAASEAPKASDGASKAGAAGTEIDEIFSRGKAKRKTEEAAEEVGKDDRLGADAPPKKKKKTSQSNEKQKSSASNNQEEAVGKSSLPSRPRKKTNEGLSVYTEDELGWNRKDAGGTPLCPFDCSCCF
ncbi:hypothetical protein L7F22_037888 [Adiantum nelumboides]|nr:hypothetical protein [Adiantum nelumboides]